MNTKVCKICKIEKDYSEYHKSKLCVGGVRTTCTECRKEEKKEYSARDYVIEKKKRKYQENKESIRERLKTYYWTLTSQYHEYKKRAKKKNIDFLLSKKDCEKYYNTNCYYCDGKIKGLGIDRIDNKIGYVKDNILPCCSKCNFMKHIMSKDEFIQHIKQIIKHLNIE